MDIRTPVKTKDEAASSAEQLVADVRNGYGRIAEGKVDGCCGPTCCA